jgi:hypothetical protein
LNQVPARHFDYQPFAQHQAIHEISGPVLTGTVLRWSFLEAGQQYPAALPEYSDEPEEETGLQQKPLPIRWASAPEVHLLRGLEQSLSEKYS